ncbi:helix-turn-helix domain-containing protein [Plantactinospora siamensis]|uniref:Helix-turn-helix domain-containing protein n=1 Tax=Plantactinospora siamensis TaxID=555372 RepID=A0ABV6NSB4_9ACTN
MDQPVSTVPRRQLGRCLQQLRDRGNLSMRAVSDAVGCSRQKLWRIERGVGPVRPTDVHRLCAYYRAPAEVTGPLLALARQAPAAGWWRADDEIPPDGLDPYPALEAEAVRLRCYAAELVPALLRTPDYAAEVLRVQRPDWPADRRARWAADAGRRQRILARRSGRLPPAEFILGEPVLRRPVAGATAAQLVRLARLAQRPAVRLRVLTLRAGPHPAAGDFTLLDFAGPPGRSGVVHRDGPTGALYLDRPGDVARHAAIWAELVRLSLSELESAALIAAFARG